MTTRTSRPGKEDGIQGVGGRGIGGKREGVEEEEGDVSKIIHKTNHFCFIRQLGIFKDSEQYTEERVKSEAQSESRNESKIFMRTDCKNKNKNKIRVTS